MLVMITGNIDCLTASLPFFKSTKIIITDSEYLKTSMSAFIHIGRYVIPVSYTHLDVYKRQL